MPTKDDFQKSKKLQKRYFHSKMPKGESRPLQGGMMNSFKYRNIRKRFLHARPIYGWENLIIPKMQKLQKKSEPNPPAGPVDGGRQDPWDGRRSSWGSRRWRGASWGWTLSTTSPLPSPSLLLSSPPSSPSIWYWQNNMITSIHLFPKRKSQEVSTKR